MKIKFLKDFMATQSDDFRDLHPILIKRGDIVDVDGCEYNDSYFDMPKEQAQWLIDNGFAEKADGEWPQEGSEYWTVNGDGYIGSTRWWNDGIDKDRQCIGNVFKTKESAKRFIDYLEAVATVSQDEGFMLQTTRGNGVVGSDVATVVKEAGSFRVRKIDYVYRRAGAFYFDTCGHAYSSIAKHHSAWQTIYDYKWGKE